MAAGSAEGDGGGGSVRATEGGGSVRAMAAGECAEGDGAGACARASVAGSVEGERGGSVSVPKWGVWTATVQVQHGHPHTHPHGRPHIPKHVHGRRGGVAGDGGGGPECAEGYGDGGVWRARGAGSVRGPEWVVGTVTARVPHGTLTKTPTFALTFSHTERPAGECGVWQGVWRARGVGV